MSIRHPLAVFICMAMAAALIWSKALLAITAILLALVACTDIQIQPFRLRWVLTPTAVKESIKARPWLWVFSLFFFLYIVSFVYAGDIKAWWSLTHMKSDFLVVALSFAMLKPFSRKDFMMVMLTLIALAWWSSIWVQVGYFQNFELFNKMLGQGGVLPVPTNHIRYSIIIAICAITCAGMAFENMTLRYAWERKVYIALAIYFFYFLHLLAVRSGLMVGYAGGMLMVLFYTHKMRLWQRASLLLLLAISPYLAYTLFPGVKQKVHYALYDFKQFQQDQASNYSDSERWRSFKAGLDIGNRHPFFGTGTGSFTRELADYYQEHFNLSKWNRPHNQYMNVFTLFGLTGLAIFLFIIIYPMTFSFFWKPPWIATIYIMQLISMLVEHPVDTAPGTSLFLLLTLLGMSYQEYENRKKHHVTATDLP